MSIRKTEKEQEEMISQIAELWDLLKPMEEKIIKKAKNKAQRKNIFAARKSVLNNADNLYKKRKNHRCI